MITSANNRPEPMNSSPLHPKVKVSMTLAHPVYVAGKFVAGKMEVECRADKGLGISIIMVELLAVQELTSRDHSATSTFLHSRRLFQGPDLPPSNAVQAHPLPGDTPYPTHYHQALRGISTFLFRIPLPSSAPSSISFGSDLARVRYELRATVGVIWKGEKTLVVCNREIDVVESFEDNPTRTKPEGIVVGEFGEIWVQGSVVGDIIVAGESACLELQVKNHSNKRNTGLTLSLTRSLVLSGSITGEASLLQISDDLATVPFHGPDYIITPGTEGVASIVFDVPNHARGVRAGPYEGGDLENRLSESIFEVRCILGITINMEFGTKDIHLDIPVIIAHPDAVPVPAEFTGYLYPEPVSLPQRPYAQFGLPIIPAACISSDQSQVWLPSSPSHTPHINGINHLSPPVDGVEPQYYFPLSPRVDIPYVPTGLMNTEPADYSSASYETGFEDLVLPLTYQPLPNPFDEIEPEKDKGERASRVTQHLRMSSRHRSASPQPHRSPLPMSPTEMKQISSLWAEQLKLDNLHSPPSVPLTLPATSSPTEPSIHAPFPFLSPKLPNSLLKSDCVEEFECMDEELEKSTVELSSESPMPIFEAYNFDADRVIFPVHSAEGSQVTELRITKTLPVPPSVTKKAKKAKGNGTTKLGGRTRIDEFFANASHAPTELQTPKTPMAAVTPVRLPLKPKSAECMAHLDPNGQVESGLNALENRLLAEVGTRNMELEGERQPAWSIIGTRLIDIPSKNCVPDDPMNDSVISSLTLAGERIGFDHEEVEFNGVLDDAEHDSDEKTHRAGKSTGSAGSRKGAKEKGAKRKKRGKKDKDRIEDQGQDAESHHRRKKKTAAAKGRVAAWLGAIDPDVPPAEDVLPPSPAVSREFSSFMESKEVPLSVVDGDIASLANKPLNAVESKGTPNDAAPAPDPRSSGFVPIGMFKSGIPPSFKPLSKNAIMAREAQRVADTESASTWTSTVPAPLILTPPENSPLLKNVSPAFALFCPLPEVAPFDKATSPLTAGVADILEAKNYDVDAGKASNMKSESPKLNTTMQTWQSEALPTPHGNAEAKYNAQCLRGGRGGIVTAISSFWATGAVEPTTLAPSKPLWNCAPSITPKVPEQSYVKSLPATRAPAILPPNPELGSVDFASRRPRPIVKSTSVPAIISSLHATPTLSSTASLAHLACAKPTIRKLSPVVSEGRSDSILGQTSAKIALSSSKPGSTGGDMVFGQARLRDLIKRYQGHAV